MIKNKINDYRICEKRIGKGSFSTIYKCFDKNNNEYAIKNFNIDKPKDKKIILNEFNIIRKLDHINIIKVFDLIIDNDLNNIYIILEYFEKGDLSKFLNGSVIPEYNANNYSIQIKNGLKYLLSKDILHRDIKPQNILVSKDNILKITDFGLSKYINNNQLLNTICGSPLYMAPEILKHKKYTIKSDIWSFGIIIYEMVYGFIPFKSDNIYNLIKKIDSNKLFFNKKISKDCINLLTLMLKKDPSKRIEWKDLFEHKWLTNDLLLKKENNLIEIPVGSSNNLHSIYQIKNSINNSVNNSVNNSFKYKSIANKIDTSLEFNFNLKESLDSLNSSCSLDSSLYYSLSDTNSDYENENENLYKIKDKKTKICKSNPIDIINNNNNSNYNNSNYNKSNSSESTNLLKNSFVFVNLESPSDDNFNEIRKQSKFKEYLNNSITFVKQSCDYINKSSSL